MPSYQYFVDSLNEKFPWVVSLVFLVTAKCKRLLSSNLVTRTALDELEMCQYHTNTIIYNKVLLILKVL